jgi:[histone H3]-lysine36 N-dimethyltransferase SETMAR
MQKFEQRAYIKACVALKQEVRMIHSNLVLIHNDQAYNHRTVTRWVALFKKNVTRIENKKWSPRPVTKCTRHNIKLVRDLIDENPRIGYTILEEKTKLSRGTLQKIITVHLKMKKKASRWIPHVMTSQNKLRRYQFAKAMLEKLNTGQWRLDEILTADECWICWKQTAKRQSSHTWRKKNQPPSTIARVSRFAKKTMFTIFFNSGGGVYVDWLDQKKTIDSQYYIENCLMPAFEEIKKKRPKSGLKGIKLLHDGARPHVKDTTEIYIQSSQIQIIDHPPYSPDLAPCDYWLFDKIKNHLRTLDEFKSAEELADAVTSFLSTIDHSEFIKTFQKYKERLEWCLSVKGDYFEHLIK